MIVCSGTYYELVVSVWITLIQWNRFILKFIVVLCLLVYYATNSMFELETERLFR